MTAFSASGEREWIADGRWTATTAFGKLRCNYVCLYGTYGLGDRVTEAKVFNWAGITDQISRSSVNHPYMGGKWKMENDRIL
jgi:hypothetical protein